MSLTETMVVDGRERAVKLIGTLEEGGGGRGEEKVAGYLNLK